MSANEPNTTGWSSPDGLLFLKNLLTRLVPWPGGPRDWQIQCTAHILDGKDQLVVAGCGEGKTAIAYLHILVYRELLKDPKLPRYGLTHLPRKPVALIASPLTDLSLSQVSEMSRIGIRAVSLDRESVKRLKRQGISAFKSVRQCDWSVVLASPERLTAPEFDTIVRDDTFRSNITLYVVDEAHVLRPWSLTFRKCYDDIPQIRLRIPLRVPILALTATLQPGPTEKALCQTLRFRSQHCITRRPSERLNCCLIFHTLSHGLDGLEFPDLAWYAAGKYKFILYCKTIELGFRVASYLWRLLPKGTDRRRKIRLYNSLISPEVNEATVKAIDGDPDTLGVVATMKFGLGIDVRRVVIVGSVGTPDSVEGNRQEAGRSVRDPTINGASITYIEKGVVSTIAKELKAGKASGYSSDSEMETVRGERVSEIRAHQKMHRRTNDDTQIAIDTRQLGNGTRRTICPGVRQLIASHILHRCLIAASNRIFGNVYPQSSLSCFDARRPLPCSSCLALHSDIAPSAVTTAGTRSVYNMAQSSKIDADTSSNLLSLGNYPPLTKAMRTQASTVLDSFSRSRWLVKEGLCFRHIPYTAYIPSMMRKQLLDNFHLIRDREALAGVLAEWQFIDDDLNALFEEVKSLNLRFDREHQGAQSTRNAKSAETRRRKAAENQTIQRAALQNQAANTPTALQSNPSACSTQTDSLDRRDDENVSSSTQYPTLFSPRRTRNSTRRQRAESATFSPDVLSPKKRARI